MKNPSQSPSRLDRRALLRSAAVAIPAVALPTATALAAAGTDPVFALIEAHKEAERDLNEHCCLEEHLSDIIPDEKRKSSSWGWELTIVETDDPRWIDFTRAWVSLSQRVDEIACELVSVPSLSLAGAAALLTYAIEHVDAGYVWPDVLADNEGTFGDWNSFLHRAILGALEDATALA